MGVYKDPKTKTWYVSVPINKADGTKGRTTKRGFSKKTEALEWERDYLIGHASGVDISFEELAEEYMKERFPRMKESTSYSCEKIIRNRLMPTFGNRMIQEIAPRDINRWQNSLLASGNAENGKPYKKSYIQKLTDVLSQVFSFAVKRYGLRENPVTKADAISNVAEEKMKFWTLEEYRKFVDSIREDRLAYMCFETLYWTGIREGEMMALTWADVDFEKKELVISKTMHMRNGEPIVTGPKTEAGNRRVVMPDRLCEEIMKYKEHCQLTADTDRVYMVYPYTLYRRMRIACKKTGQKPIRIHDLRHSHVSLLINMGYSAVDIAKRMGHENTEITFNYAHLFPSEQNRIAEELDTMRLNMVKEAKENE